MPAAESERLLGSSGQEHEFDRLADDDGGDRQGTEPPLVLRTNPGVFQRRELALSARRGRLHVDMIWQGDLTLQLR